MKMETQKIFPPHGVYPADYRLAAQLMQKNFRKVSRLHTRWKRLEVQKRIRFMLSDHLAGTWVKLVQEENQFVQDFETYAPGQFEKTLSITRRKAAFKIENEIFDFAYMTIKHEGRKFFVYCPYFEGPNLTRRAAGVTCRRCGLSAERPISSRDGRHRCPHCNTPETFWRRDELLLQLHPGMTKQDFNEMWPYVKQFLSEDRKKTPFKNISSKWDRNQEWVRYKLGGKTLDEIVKIELRSKRRFTWKKKYPKSTRSRLKKLIRESLRHYGRRSQLSIDAET